jgi:hypothetical protein
MNWKEKRHYWVKQGRCDFIITNVYTISGATNISKLKPGHNVLTS